MRRAVVIAFLTYSAVVLLVFLLGRISYAVVTSDDAFSYIAQVTAPNSVRAHEPPYAWRILTPFIVAHLPVSVQTGFSIVTTASLGGTVLTLLWVLRALGVSRPLGGALAFVFLGPATIFSLSDYARIDALAFLLLTLAILFTLQRNGFLLFLTICLFSFDKETAIFGALFALIWSLQQRDRRMMVWSMCGLVASLVILYALRTFISASAHYTLPGAFAGVTLNWLANGTGWSRIQEALIGTWGVLLPLAVWHIGHPQSIWRQRACGLLVLLATLQIFVSLDIERVVVYAFPVMIAAAACSVEDLATRWHVSQWVLWSVIYLSEITWEFMWGPGYFFIIHGWHGVEVGAIAVFTAAALIYSLKVRQESQQRTPTDSSDQLLAT